MSDLNVLGTSPMGIDSDKVASYNTVQTPARGTFSQASSLDVIDKHLSKDGLENAPKATAKEIGEAVDEVNAFMTNMQHNLSFSVDEDSGEPIVFIKDSDTDEVIRQIPSEELVVLRKKLDDVTGILFDTKV